jgi:hypothetical protein
MSVSVPNGYAADRVGYAPLQSSTSARSQDPLADALGFDLNAFLAPSNDASPAMSDLLASLFSDDSGTTALDWFNQMMGDTTASQVDTTATPADPAAPAPMVLTGTASADRIVGGAGADRLSGGAGNDRIRGRAGSDFINGGSGHRDVAGFAGAKRNYDIDHTGRNQYTVTDKRTGEVDTVKGVERLRFGRGQVVDLPVQPQRAGRK